MRLLVLSDSHSRKERLANILATEPMADAVFHLGDGAADMIFLQDTDPRTFFLLRGNCDSAFREELKDTETVTFENTRIFATHGHLYNVKFGLDKIGLVAGMQNMQLVLFGHTHNPTVHYENGIHFFNPGSVAEGFYGCVDITQKGIICLHKEIKM
ncbi:MAG: YfcE family phosphodiesterase [Clostridia bacterium]|nr:YfcE family phosphodiesterase [Clostridia bacterium]MBR2413117.1 YfcE family phosphodiesterase [Clostridia bacterium]MBR3954928.1 YfcE family phosphodiesterase [Clostridia bacterium]